MRKRSAAAPMTTSKMLVILVALTGIGPFTSTVIYRILVNFENVTVGTSGTAPATLATASNKTMTIQSITAAPGVCTGTNNCGSSLALGLS